MKACHHVFEHKWVQAGIIILYLFLASSLLIAFLLPLSPVQRAVKLVSNYWLGILEYILLVLLLADGLRLILKKCSFSGKERLFSRGGHAAVGTLCFAAVCLAAVLGIMGTHKLYATEYEAAVYKEAGNRQTLDIALAADLHLGYSVGCREMERMVGEINRGKPDLVVIAGDIFDNEYEALDNPEELAEILSKIESRYGVFACYGNHDIQEKILAGFTFSGKKKKMSDPRMDEFLEKAGIRLLRDEGLLIDDSFYLYGRPDAKSPGRGIKARLEPDEITRTMDKTKPIVIIDHQPSQLRELAEAGADLDLCGHTHDGQLFPGNLLMHFIWENPCGYLKKGNMHNIVTSGVGVFGPDMRVGTKSEICRIKVRFSGAK